MGIMKILWPTLLIGIVVVAISYIRMRDQIPFQKRERLEKIVMILLLIFLMIDIGFAIKERRDSTMEINDCIRFYRYFPNFYKDAEFYFINEWCYNYFNEEEIKGLRESGQAWRLKQLEKGNINIWG